MKNAGFTLAISRKNIENKLPVCYDYRWNNVFAGSWLFKKKYCRIVKDDDWRALATLLWEYAMTMSFFTLKEMVTIDYYAWPGVEWQWVNAYKAKKKKSPSFIIINK